MKERIKKLLAVGSSLVYCHLLIPCAVYAGDKEDKIIKDIDSKVNFFVNLFLTVIQGGGGILLGYGLFSFSTAFSSRQTSEIGDALLKCGGGVVMLVIPGLIKLWT